MDKWLRFFQDASENQILENPEAIAQMFSLDVGTPHVAVIQANLSQSSEGEINRTVEQANVMKGDWPGFVSLCKAYIHWCVNVDPANPGNSFESFAKVFLALQQAFANVRGSCLNILIQHVVWTMERLFMNRGKLHVEWIAAGILKLFNSVRSERELPAFGISKKDNILFYANMISRVYFKSEQFVSAGNVFKNMYSLDVRFSQFPLSQQVEYRYWVGRFCIYANQLEQAYMHLNWAWSKCNSNQPQYFLILNWLVLPSVLIGRIPSAALLSLLSREAQDAVSTVAQAMKTGQYPPHLVEVLQHNPWIQSRHLRPIVEAHLPILVFRKGIHRLIKLSGLDRLPLQLCRSACHFTVADDPDLVLTEAVCIELISKGLMKGNLLPRSGLVALKSRGSIPSLSEYYDLRLPERESWLLA